MSQSPNPKDSQALLQSMLQRLKLQPGKEGQPHLHTPVPTTAASTWGQDGERGAPNLQKVNSSLVNGFGTNGIPSTEFGSAVDGKFAFKGGKQQQPGHESEVDRGLISFPSQKDNIDGDTGEKRVLGQPGNTPTGTGHLFPAKSLKDADITSFERTDGARMIFGSSANTRHIPRNKDAVTSVDQDKGFTPKVYSWSLKPTGANVSTGSQGVAHMGNGGFGASAQSKDMRIVPANNSYRIKQQSSENKARKWTQKIKERWRDRPGSFGKKGKQDRRRVEQKSEQGTDISPQNQLLTAENAFDTSNTEEERSLSSLDGSDISPIHTDDGGNEGRRRSSGDFEFGLGSFSLLEEITVGQKWATFLNPNQSPTQANQKPPELKIPPHESCQSSPILNLDNQWSFKATETSPDLDFSMAQISPDAFQPVSMDLSEGKQAAERDVHSEVDQSEPMEHGQTRRTPSLVEPADVVDSSALKSRVQLSRKRQHQSAYSNERLQREKRSDADREGSMSPLSLTSNHMTEETGESQHDNFRPFHTTNSTPPPLSPFNPFAPACRGVLKHSISQDSQCSMETETKRRRVEENRRVHFSEEVVAIEPPELDPDATDSEEDAVSEEDSVTEQESDEEREALEVVAAAAAARRPSLPTWIQALKKKNTRRKLRKGL